MLIVNMMLLSLSVYSQSPFSSLESRKKMMIDSIATWASGLSKAEFIDSEGGKYGAFLAMALYEKGEIEKARKFTAWQLEGEGDMFREFGTMTLYMKYHELYGEALCQKVKQNQLKSDFFQPKEENFKGEVSQSHRITRLGGASENHKLMYACAAYLAGIAWPDEYPKEWFQAGYDHLMYWFSTVTSIGFWEEDSPTYLIHHMGPVLSVAEFAPEGSEMKKRATMVLEWYFLSMAGEYLHGYWITPAARDYNPLYGLAFSAETSALMWLYFDDASMVPYPHVSNHFRHWKASIHFAVSDFELPDIIKRIATDRDESFVHREFMAKNPLRPKEYCYLNKIYGMASILSEEGPMVPDMTRWKIQWIANSPEKEPCVFFMKHPYIEPDSRNPEKWKQWRGASTAEQVIQYKNALLAVYKIDDDQLPFIDGPFQKESFEVIKYHNKWIFAHAGSCLLAIYAVKGFETNTKHHISDSHGPMKSICTIQSQGKRNGLIVQTALPEVYSGKTYEEVLELFKDDVLERTGIDTLGIKNENPVLTYKSLSGDVLEIKFNGYKKLNGELIDFENWPLLENPWMHQDYKGSQLILNHGGEKRIYDFDKWVIEDKLLLDAFQPQNQNLPDKKVIKQH